jgi:hypothetical protein
MLPLLTTNSTSDKNGGFICGTEVFRNLTEDFPCFFLSCKANARVKLAKAGHGPHSSTLVVICVLLWFVRKCVLPPDDNPIAVNKYITSYLVTDSLLLVYQRHVLSTTCSPIERYLIV